MFNVAKQHNVLRSQVCLSRSVRTQESSRDTASSAARQWGKEESRKSRAESRLELSSEPVASRRQNVAGDIFATDYLE